MGQLAPIPLVAPGSLGLNKEQENTILDPRWATVATNCVLDRNGRLAARKGWTDQSSAGPIAGADTIDVLHEFITQAGVRTVITAAGLKIYKDIDDYTDAANDITSTTAPSADDWQFVNFNNKVIGIQAGEILIEWAGSGNFTDIVAANGTLPSGSCGTAAFGRLWIADSDKQTIKYCALLDETEWDSGTSDAGSINMRHVWTKGTDQVMAIAALSSSLVVFGRRHVIIWEDGQGSDIGLNPANIHVVQTIEDTGTNTRDSVQNIGEGDMLFLSRHGVQSLGQLVQEKERPTSNLTKNYRTDIKTLMQAATLTAVRSVFHPEDGIYVLTFPASKKSVVLDTRRMFVDDEGDKVARVTEWEHRVAPSALLSRQNGDLLMGFNGVVGKYTGNVDGAIAYAVDYMSSWLELGPELAGRLKILKEIVALVSVTASATIRYKWEFDFSGILNSEKVFYDTGTQAEYNTAEFNIAEFSGGSFPVRTSIDASNEGQFIRVGFIASVNSFDVALQQLQLYFKIGRMI